jgi:hypothetical protein
MKEKTEDRRDDEKKEDGIRTAATDSHHGDTETRRHGDTEKTG